MSTSAQLPFSSQGLGHVRRAFVCLVYRKKPAIVCGRFSHNGPYLRCSFLYFPSELVHSFFVFALSAHASLLTTNSPNKKSSETYFLSFFVRCTIRGTAALRYSKGRKLFRRCANTLNLVPALVCSPVFFFFCFVLMVGGCFVRIWRAEFSCGERR